MVDANKANKIIGKVEFENDLLEIGAQVYEQTSVHRGLLERGDTTEYLETIANEIFGDPAIPKQGTAD
jgi:hypothetical protein